MRILLHSPALYQVISQALFLPANQVRLLHRNQVVSHPCVQRDNHRHYPVPNRRLFPLYSHPLNRVHVHRLSQVRYPQCNRLRCQHHNRHRYRVHSLLRIRQHSRVMLPLYNPVQCLVYNRHLLLRWLPQDFPRLSRPLNPLVFRPRFLPRSLLCSPPEIPVANPRCSPAQCLVHSRVPNLRRSHRASPLVSRHVSHPHNPHHLQAPSRAVSLLLSPVVCLQCSRLVAPLRSLRLLHQFSPRLSQVVNHRQLQQCNRLTHRHRSRVLLPV